MKTMKVIVLEPMKEAYLKEIEKSLTGMQKVVGGYIQGIYPFEEEVCLVVNDEGKINGLPLNRALFDDNGKIYDIIAGTAFICGCSKDSFVSLSKKHQEKFLAMFKYPETFVSMNGEIVAIPIKSNENRRGII